VYTQCPECQTTVRITVEVLQTEGGCIQCDDCGNTFNTIEHLLEELPESKDNAVAGIEEDDFREKSKALLETLTELANPGKLQTEENGEEPGRSVTENEPRYDDNTPLPDGFEDEDATAYSLPLGASQAAAIDDEEQVEFDTRQIDLALGGDEDWEELLDGNDVAEPTEDDKLTEGQHDDEATIEERPEHAEEDDDELTAAEEADIVDRLRESSGAFRKQIEAAKRTLNGSNDEDSERAEENSGSEQADTGAEAEQEGSNQDAEDALSQTMIRAGIDPALLDEENAETIIMEGELINGSPDDERDGADNQSVVDLGNQIDLIDTYMLNKGRVRGGRRQSDPAGFGVIAAVVVLLVVLVAQYLHMSRQVFATYGAFNQTLGPIYRAIGQPISPKWNLQAWKFERTSGNIEEGDDVLTVLSQVRNTSDKPLPLPLVHVSLTDRWEEVIGSRIVEPADYLAVDMDPHKHVAPGDAFNSVIVIQEPSPQATGFQLYVCYRLESSRLRCAIEDFRN